MGESDTSGISFGSPISPIEEVGGDVFGQRRQSHELTGEKIASDREKAKNGLVEMYSTLCEALEPNGLTRHLYSSGLLSTEERDVIQARPTRLEKSEEILKAIERRSKDDIFSFCTILLTKGERTLGIMLKDALERKGLDVTSLKVPPVGQPTIHHESPKYYPAIEDLETPFIGLVREVRQEAVKVSDLSTICNQLLTRCARLKDPTLRERLHELNNCSNEEAFGYLQHHIDELDCDLLYKLIMQIKNQRLIDDWDSYRGKVKEACSVTLDKCRKEQQKKKSFSKEYLTLGFQTNQVASDTTIQRILDLKDFLINRVGLEEAKFEGVANSAVTLFFGISKKHMPFLLHRLSRHRRSLLEFNVTVVFVPGVFIYDLVTEEDYQYPEDTLVSSFATDLSHIESQMEQHFQLLKQMQKDIREHKDLERSNVSLQNRLTMLQIDNSELYKFLARTGVSGTMASRVSSPITKFHPLTRHRPTSSLSNLSLSSVMGISGLDSSSLPSYRRLSLVSRDSGISNSTVQSGRMPFARKKKESVQLLKQAQATSRWSYPIADGRDSENTEFSSGSSSALLDPDEHSEEDDTCSDLNISSDRSTHPTCTLKLPTVGGTSNVMENSMPTRDPSATGHRSATPTKKGSKGKSKKTRHSAHTLAAVYSTKPTPKQKYSL